MKIQLLFILILMPLISFAQLISTDGSALAQDGSFKPIPGQTYVISAWVLEAGDQRNQPPTYENSHIEVVLSDTQTVSFFPSGNIIDKWQRIIGNFTIPNDAEVFELKLKSTALALNSYFDDVRIYPFNGNMKSFVYDPQTQRLMAELDENNYATFYEYDTEGGLVRVKKETERGVKTIQETRSSTAKQ